MVTIADDLTHGSEPFSISGDAEGKDTEQKFYKNLTEIQ
jgi:hypothetical protein